ncbi:MAG TPA: hypothetical protein VFW90_03930 [Candidatus Saccharimonadales bacterium]|nr:hypothetical protein [Candidatus Saccharimonadales bacterium]
MAKPETRKAEDYVLHRGIALPFNEFEFDPETGEVTAIMAFRDEHTTGHFPGNPVVPGHWSVETMAIAAGLAGSDELAASGKVPVLAAIEGARFKKTLRPGEEVTVHGELTRKSAVALKGIGRITVGNEVAATLDGFTVMLADPEQVQNA